MDLRLTSLLYSKEVEPGIVGIYNNIFGHNFVFVPKAMFEAMQRNRIPNSEQGLSELVDKYFLVPTNFSEAAYITAYQKGLKVDIHLMYLLLTQSCNLSCTYCFERLGSDMDKLMSWPVADRAIDYFFEVATPDRMIIFYGGEPLMNRDVFVKAVDKIREKEKATGLDTKVTMVCNGTLITPDLAGFIAKKNVEVAVSIDGPEAIHNRARINRGSSGHSGSYAEAMRGFNFLKARGAKVAISCTIGDHNINELENVAKFFVSELKPNGVGFNFLIGGTHHKTTMHDSTKQLLKAYEVLRDNGIYEDRVMRRLKAITSGAAHIKDCGAYGNQIAVRYDGKVGPCHAFCNSGDYYSGDITSSGFQLNRQVFERWANRSQLFNPVCVSCPASLVCGGGCAFSAQRTNGSLDDIDRNICTHSFLLLDWIMEETWKQKRRQQ